MENASEGTHSNKNSHSISSEESAGLSVCPTTHLKMFRQKETPIGYYAAIILNYRNVEKHLWREPQIIKFENAFHIRIRMSFIGQVCLHIRGICYRPFQGRKQ